MGGVDRLEFFCSCLLGWSVADVPVVSGKWERVAYIGFVKDVEELGILETLIIGFNLL